MILRNYYGLGNKEPMTLEEIGKELSISRERVRQLSKDVPTLWRSKTTKQSDRKKVVRILIREVWLNQVDEPRCTNVRIMWQSGAVTEADIDRPWPIGVRSKTPEEVVDAVRKLDAESLTPQEIAEELNQRGLRAKRGHRYNARMVRYLLRTRRIGRYHESEETDEAR